MIDIQEAPRTAPPPVRLAVLASIAAIFVMAALQACNPVLFDDPDFWWRLRTGQWITSHGAVPRADPFSQYGLGRPWVDYTWIFDLALYAAFAHGGAASVALFVAVLWGASVAVLFLHARSSGLAIQAAAGICFVFLVVLHKMVVPRPWLASILLFLVEMGFCMRFVRNRDTSRLWPLLLLFVLWANLHIQFVYGLLALVLLSAVYGRRYPGLFLVTAGCAAAALLNPYGVGVYRVVFEYAGQGELSRIIPELSPPDLRHVSSWIVIAISGAALWMTWRRAQRDWFSLLLVAVATVLFLRSQRDEWYLICAALSVIGWTGDVSDARVRGSQWLAIAGLGVGVLAFRLPSLSSSVDAELAGIYPVQAVRNVAAQGYTGPLLNTFDWGGFLIWNLPAIPVAIDGRTNVHPAARVQQFHEAWNGRDPKQAEQLLASAGLVIAPPSYALTGQLLRDARFQVAYRDAVSVVFIRSTRRYTDQLKPDSGAAPKP